MAGEHLDGLWRGRRSLIPKLVPNSSELTRTLGREWPYRGKSALLDIFRPDF